MTSKKGFDGSNSEFDPSGFWEGQEQSICGHL